jgi:hypothetical protein
MSSSGAIKLAFQQARNEINLFKKDHLMRMEAFFRLDYFKSVSVFYHQRKKAHFR